MSYDHLGQLVQADYGNGNVIEYSYDTIGNRMTLTSASAADQPPLISTLPVTHSTTLSARVTPNGTATTVWFEWGLTEELGNTTSAKALSDPIDTVTFNDTLTGLSPLTGFYYRAVAENANGTTHGGILWSFAPDTTTVDLQLTRTSVTPPATVGSHNYTLSVTNLGTDPITNVWVTETLLGVAGYEACTATMGTCSFDSEYVLWELDTLAGGDSASLDLTIQSSRSGWIYQSAEVFSASTETDSANNVSAAGIRVISRDTDGDGQFDEDDPDDDNDQIPDEWELENNLDPSNASDAAADPDGDGYSNLDEYRAGTDPNNPVDLPLSSVSSGWEWTNPLPTGVKLYAVAHGNGITVAVGEGGTVLSKTEGGKWEHRFSGTPWPLSDVAWLGDRFFAVGFERILKSADGLRWNTHRLASWQSLWSITKGGNTFVAVGEDGLILTSTDGETWTQESSPATNDFKKILWHDGRFIAAASNGDSLEIFTSPDGADWTLRYTDSSEQTVADIFWNGSMVIATTYSDKIVTSPDGINWTPGTFSIAKIHHVARNGTVFVGVGGDFSLGDAATSTDGINWSAHTISSPYLEDVTWSDDHFTAVGKDGAILVSETGESWTEESTAITRVGLNDIEATDDFFVAVGDAGTVVTGIDGVNWTKHPVPTANYLSSVAGNDETLAAVGALGTVLTSSDGINWDLQTSPSTEALQTVIWAGNQFIAVGGDEDPANPSPPVIMTSPDGMSWTLRSVSVNGKLAGVVWNGDLLVAVGNDGDNALVLTSIDGVTWTPVNVQQEALYDVAWFKNQFVAVGASGTIMTSADGAAWTAGNSPTALDLYAVAASANQVVAVGNNGVIFTSLDGVNWQEGDSGIDDFRPEYENLAFNGLVWSPPRFAIVGDYGAILRSILPVDLIQSLDDPDFLEGYYLGDERWFGQNQLRQYGGSAAQSGPITHDQFTAVSLEVQGPGTLTFYWKVSSEKDYDFLNFYIDDVFQAEISGEVDWQQMTYTLGPGRHELYWEYTKDETASAGVDAGWLDRVVFTQTHLPPVAVTDPATSVTNRTAKLNATINPNGVGTTAWFEYGPTSSYGSTVAGISPGSGTNQVSSIASLGGLTPDTTYHYRIAAANSGGVVFGEDRAFTTLALPSVEVTSPSGGEVWRTGTTHEITWTSEHVENVKIEYSLDGGNTWSEIIAGTPAAAGRHDWTLSVVPSRDTIVRISDAADADVNDASDGAFTVSPQAGDLNGDNRVDLVDAVLALQILTGVPPSATVFKGADGNSDGRIGLAEAVYALQKIAGLR